MKKSYIVRILVRLLIITLMIAWFFQSVTNRVKLEQSVAGSVNAVISSITKDPGSGDDPDHWDYHIDYEYGGKQFAHVHYASTLDENSYKLGEVVTVRVDADGTLLEVQFSNNRFFKFAAVAVIAATVYSFIFLFVHKGKPLSKKQMVLDYASLYDDLRWKATRWYGSVFFYGLSCFSFVLSAFSLFAGPHFLIFLVASIIFFVPPFRSGRKVLHQIEEKRFRLEKRPCSGRIVERDKEGDNTYYLLFSDSMRMQVAPGVYKKTTVGTEFCFVFIDPYLKPYAYYSLYDYTLDNDMFPHFEDAVQ